MDQGGHNRRTGIQSNTLKRLFLWGPLFAVVLAVWFWSGRADREIEFQQGLVDLMEGRLQEAADRFEGLESPLWNSEEFQAGAEMARSLLGQPNTTPLDPSGARRLPLRLMLADALRRANYRGCLQLADIARSVLGDEADLYEAAALLELGDRSKSSELLRGLPQSEAESWLGVRLRQVHSVLDQNAAALLQDRKGIPVGWVSNEHRIQYFDNSDAALFPTPILERILPGNLTPSIRLSIDRDLSKIALAALGHYRGSIVLVHPETGEILVAVSDRKSSKGDSLPAFEQELEPASISKLITTTAALRSGLDADEEISHMVCRGAAKFSNEYLYCSYRAGRLSGLDEALAVSCNIAFANLGNEVGKTALLAELERFGFGRPAKDGMRFGEVLKTDVNDRELADLAIGLEHSAVTPLHAALIASVFANGGRLVEPNLISGRDGWLGISARSGFSPHLQQVVEQEWLPTLLRSMRAVVNPGGTAFGVEPVDFPVAMKTGTASTPGRGYHTNYIGLGPLPDATVGFCVRITNQRTSKDVRWSSQAVVRKLLEGLKKSRDFLGEPNPLPLNWTYQLAQLNTSDPKSTRRSRRPTGSSAGHAR